MEVRELKDDMDRRFEAVDKRFEAVDRRFEEVIALIVSEGERTRRHFDVVAEHRRLEDSITGGKEIRRNSFKNKNS